MAKSYQNRSFTTIEKRRKNDKTVRGLFVRSSGSIEFSTVDTGFGKIFKDNMLDCSNVAELTRAISQSTGCSLSDAASLVEESSKKAA